MKIEFDPAKDRQNCEKHGVSLTDFALLDLDQAVFYTDDRIDYNEIRYVLLAPIADRLFFGVFTVRGGVFRVISLRKANNRERKNYEERR